MTNLRTTEQMRTYNRNSAAKRRALLNALKAGPCVDCGRLLPPECMDFDHVRGEKAFTLGHYVNGGYTGNQKTRQSAHGASVDRLAAEISKCDLVCSNCHRIRTRRRRETEAGDPHG